MRVVRGLWVGVLVWGLCGWDCVLLCQEALVRKDKEVLVDRGLLEVSVVGSRIKVLHAPLDSRMEVYGIVGEKVLEIELRGSSGEYEVDLAKGCYIVKIGEVVRKIFIR